MRLILCVVLCALSAACASHKHLIARNLADPSLRSVELDSTPFFPQREFECGPAALATALGASGVDVTPDELTSLVYIPGRKGSLQLEMQSAPRKFGRLAYPLSRNLDAIVTELEANRPVLVLHNYGLPRFPRWHYAVVVGYDAPTDQLFLRSGTERRQVMSAASFMRAWDNGGRWALVLLRPGEVPRTANATTYLEVAASFERTAIAAQSRLAFDAAIERWPDQALAWVGRGTAEYKAGSLPAAVRDYETALRLDGSNVGARNNLAMTLLELGCADRARQHLETITDEEIPASVREAVLDTRQRIAATPMSSRPSRVPACQTLP